MCGNVARRHFIEVTVTEVKHAVLSLPPLEVLMERLAATASESQAVRLCVEAARTQVFHHPDGRTDSLGSVFLFEPQLAALNYLCGDLPAGASVDIGFGMGSSACIILGARSLQAGNFRHIAIDPYGLPDSRGLVVQSYLLETFGEAFVRVKERSETALGGLIKTQGPGSAALLFIDGGHAFETVVVDFVLSDVLCKVGGYIIFDDADYPAIETALNYIEVNRPNYAFSRGVIKNTAILKKIADYHMPWDAFTPFQVAQRTGWTPVSCVAGYVASDAEFARQDGIEA